MNCAYIVNWWSILVLIFVKLIVAKPKYFFFSPGDMYEYTDIGHIYKGQGTVYTYAKRAKKKKKKKKAECNVGPALPGSKFSISNTL
jgi:hypothetical protein